MQLETICYPKGSKDAEGRDISGTYTILEDGRPTIQFKNLKELNEFYEEMKMNQYAYEAALDHYTEIQDGNL